MRKEGIILIVGFGLMLIMPFINDVFGFFEFERKNENRNPVEKPVFDVNKLDQYPAKYEEFYDDHFSFRTPLLDLNSKLKYEVFGVSPQPEKAIVGSENWYFMSRKEKLIFEGKKNLTEEQIDQYVKIWTYRDSVFKSLEIPYYWIIAPMKHYVYEDRLPFNIVPSKKGRRVNILHEALKEEVGDFIIDPLPRLKEESQDHKVYYKEDNHWNETAGFYTCQELFKRMKSDIPQIRIPQIDDYDWLDSTKSNGIHATMMGIGNTDEKDRWVSPKSKKVQSIENCGFPIDEGFLYPGEYEQRYLYDNNQNLIRALIIRDSFAEQMMPFLKTSFTETTFIFDSWQYKLNQHIIDELNPDVVIFIGLETHLENMLVDLENMN